MFPGLAIVLLQVPCPAPVEIFPLDKCPAVGDGQGLGLFFFVFSVF